MGTLLIMQLWTREFVKNIILQIQYWFPVWLSVNTLVSINIVTLCQGRLVPEWVTMFGRVNHLAQTRHASLLSLSLSCVGRQN